MMSLLPLLRRRRRLLFSSAAILLSSFTLYKILSRRPLLLRLLSLLSFPSPPPKLENPTNPIRQFSKLVNSPEFSHSLSSLSYSLALGISRALNSPTQTQSPNSSDKLINNLFSPAGIRFASTVSGSFARGLVLGFQESPSSSTGKYSELLELVCSDKGSKVVGDWIHRFVSTAVSVYLDKTMDINFYDDIFAGLTNPKHDDKMQEMIVSVCNGAMETLVRTSHQVLTSSDAELSSESGWADKVATTLAEPRNRGFVLDVTGRITFETVRSLLDYGLWRVYDGAKRGAGVVRSEFVENGLEVVRYFGARSRVVFTICIVLCMNVFMRTRVLMAE